MRADIPSKVEDTALVSRRRAQITEAAINQFAKRGYRATTMRDIARKAGISVGLIYQYVADKEDLLLLAILEVVDSYEREIPSAIMQQSSPLEQFKAAVHAYGRVVDSHKFVSALGFQETKGLKRDRIELMKRREYEANQLIVECARRCKEAGIFHAEINPEHVTYLCIVHAQGWINQAWRLDQMNIDEYIAIALDVVLNPTVVPQPPSGIEPMSTSATPGKTRRR